MSHNKKITKGLNRLIAWLLNRVWLFICINSSESKCMGRAVHLYPSTGGPLQCQRWRRHGENWLLSNSWNLKCFLMWGSGMDSQWSENILLSVSKRQWFAGKVRLTISMSVQDIHPDIPSPHKTCYLCHTVIIMECFLFWSFLFS